MTEYLQGFMPVLSSEMGHLGDELNGYVHILMFLLMFGWGIFFIYCLIRFNSKANPKASYHGVTNHYSSYVEFGIVAVEAILLIGFAIPGYSQVKYDSDIIGVSNKNDLKVRIIAQQFAWNIHYPGEDGIFGNTRIELVNEETNPIGLDRSGHGADDITTINQLHLPVNKLAKLYISSKDVIHGFALPEMRVKQDAIPGMQVPVYFTPTMTTEEFLSEIKGSPREGMGYEIACAQLCGNSHYRMKGYMTIHSEDDYVNWLKEEAEYLDSEGEDDWDDEW
jgi:cytochrome c oxidase subunit 2